MKKEQLPQSVLECVEGDALSVFLSAFQAAEGQHCSEARCFVAGYVALQQAGYSKQPSGKWTKEARNSSQLAKERPLLVQLQKVTKQDDDKKIVFGFFSVVETGGVPVIDSQGDVITADVLEDAVYRYVMFSRMGDERHDERVKAVLIESMVFTKEKQELLNIDLGFVGWWGGFKILDEAMWQKFKTGEYESFSIGGRGNYAQFNV